MRSVTHNTDTKIKDFETTLDKLKANLFSAVQYTANIATLGNLHTYVYIQNIVPLLASDDYKSNSPTDK